MLHIHKKIAPYCKGYGLFGLTYSFAVVILNICATFHIWGCGHNCHSFLCVSRMLSEQSNELIFAFPKKADILVLTSHLQWGVAGCIINITCSRALWCMNISSALNIPMIYNYPHLILEETKVTCFKVTLQKQLGLSLQSDKEFWSWTVKKNC